MGAYLDQLSSTNYTGNVVISMLGWTFSIRAPDSGITVDYPGLVQSVVINPTQIDLRRVSSTISSFSFALVDLENAVTELIEGDALSLIDSEVEIYIGRTGVGMSFADYFKLPTTRIKKIDYSDGRYTFATQEPTERLNRALYQVKSTLDVDILIETTSIDVASVADFPASGYAKIENEIISYTGRDLVEKRLTGCIRGEFSTVPAAHDSGVDVYALERVVGSPLDLVLKLLISAGGGGSWDALADGCGLSPSLIDVAGVEELRDEEFPGVTVTAYLYQIGSGLKWIEEEILTPLSLRFATSPDSKLTLKRTDRISVREAGSEITNSTIKGSPKWSVDASRIVNQIEVEWDYSEALGKYQHRSTYTDEISATAYGLKDKLSFRFKTVRDQAIVDEFATRTLRRLSVPTPEVNLTTHIDQSLLGPVDQARVVTTLPDYSGALEFARDLEVVSRAINYMSGDVQFRLAFTSSTQHRFGFIAPSDTIIAQPASNRLTLGAGRGAYYVTGWKMRLWEKSPRAQTGDALNTITAIEGDTLVFEDPWTTTVAGSTHEIRFGGYSEAAEDQKRFAFVGVDSADFSDGKTSYQITYG